MFNYLNKEQWMMIGVSLITGMIGAIIVQIVFVKHSLPIATINITGMVQSYVQETAKQNISMQEKQDRINRFAALLTKSTEQLARDNSIVILPSEAVIAGSSDLTKQTKEMVKKGLSS